MQKPQHLTTSASNFMGEASASMGNINNNQLLPSIENDFDFSAFLQDAEAETVDQKGDMIDPMLTSMNLDCK